MGGNGEESGTSAPGDCLPVGREGEEERSQRAQGFATGKRKTGLYQETWLPDGLARSYQIPGRHHLPGLVPAPLRPASPDRAITPQ